MNNSNSSKTDQNNKSQNPPLFVKSAINLTPHKTIRIAVSGDVQLNKLETEIVNTADFQRLRRIKQLGTTYLVYPTAVHTRFDHSLGTMSMASIMIRCIRENKHNEDDERHIPEEDEQIIRLLALLHDVTHIPFGHTLEDESFVFARHDKNEDRIKRFLGEESSIGKIIITSLGKDFYQRFIKIYNAGKNDLEELEEDLYIYDLVNNTVCADLLDYLRRDCFFCNLTLDMEYRFLRFLYLRREGGKRRVVIRLWKEDKPRARPDLLSELVRLLDNRYLLAERVYFHHAKLTSGAMLADAVLREKLEGRIKEEHLWELGDEALLDRLSRSKNQAVKKLALAVSNRNLWQDIYERTKDQINAEQTSLRDISVMNLTMDYWWKDINRRKEDEDTIAKLLGMDEGDLIIYCPDNRMNMKLAEMKVQWNGELKSLKDCDDDPLSKKLENILKSHGDLWAMHGLLNPLYEKQKKDQVRDACDLFLSFHSRTVPQKYRQFFTGIVEEIASSKNLHENISFLEFQNRRDKAVELLCSETNKNRDINTIEKVVINAFTQRI